MKNSQDIKHYIEASMLTLILFLLSIINSTAQTAQEFFVGGANLYINGQFASAKDYVNYALSKFPDDKKLIALKKRIEEENPDEKQNQDQKENQNKDNQDKQQQQQQQQQNQQQGISKEDAQRLLNALANDEKNVQEKVKLAKATKAKVRTVKNW
jgi:Arc/MetJ-type ribon-helix-helix transcriptional regulator